METVFSNDFQLLSIIFFRAIFYVFPLLLLWIVKIFNVDAINASKYNAGTNQSGYTRGLSLGVQFN